MTGLEPVSPGEQGPPADASAPARVLRWARTIDFDRLNRRFGPWIALGSGALTLVFWRRGASFAPTAVAGLLFAWTAAVAASRLLVEREGEAKWRRTARVLTGTVIAGLYQDALFFLLPLWFGSASWASLNIVFPALLAAMAVFSCFEHLYTEHVLDRPARRTIWTAVVLFATLVAAVPVLSALSPRLSLAAAAAVSALATAFAVTPLQSLRTPRGGAFVSGAALGAAILAALIAPLLPPVPLHTNDAKIGLEIVDKEIIEEHDTIAAGTPKVYAWFTVSAPPSYKQPVVFEWYRDGDLVGRPFQTTITGGRKAGFRVWASMSAPRRGSWRVDLYTDGGQLLARKWFDVE